MRNVNPHASIGALSAQPTWRSGWAGRLILATLLIAASALVLMPDRASAHHAPGTTYETHCQSSRSSGDLTPDLAGSEDFVRDCIALLKAIEKLVVSEDTTINWMVETRSNLPLLEVDTTGESRWDGVWIGQVGEAPNQEYRITRVDLSDADLSGELAPEWPS